MQPVETIVASSVSPQIVIWLPVESLASLADSPVGLRFATGRLDLNLPIELVSLTLAVFLLIWSGAFVSYAARGERFSTSLCRAFH